MSEATKRAAAFMAEYGLKVESVFVPFSKSRNKGKNPPSLNWVVTVKRNGRDFITTDYGAGCGHCPAYNAKESDKHIKRQLIALECEQGVKSAVKFGQRIVAASPRVLLTPDAADVVHSLIMDSSVLDSSGFENWAGEFGYDTDSRQAESIYRACLEIALKFRAAIGDKGMEAAREAFQDY